MSSSPGPGGQIIQGQQPPPSAATGDSVRLDNRRSRWRPKKIHWRPRKLSKHLALAVIGLGFLAGGLLMYLYSGPGELASPPFTTIQLQSTFSIAEILYDVSEPAPSITQITIYVQLPAKQLHPPAKAKAAELWLEVPPGIAFQTCPPDSCRFDPNDQAYTWLQPLDFRYEDPDNKSGEAKATFSIKAHSLGYVANYINASAAIPRVVFWAPRKPPATFLKLYKVTSAHNYDWSTLHPQLANASEVIWSEPMTSAAEGTVAVGADQANELKENYEILFAGALIGLAGGALLAAAQEWLHRNDDEATMKAMVGALQFHLGGGRPPGGGQEREGDVKD
jgi:hypothetical protein